MKRLFVAIALVLAACGVPESQLRQVSIESPEAFALSLREAPARVLRSLGLSYGLTVVKAGAAAERAGLRVGDVVYAVNERRLRAIEDFTRVVAARPATLTFVVRRGGLDLYLPLELGGPSPLPAKDRLLRT